MMQEANISHDVDDVSLMSSDSFADVISRVDIFGGDYYKISRLVID